MKSRANSAKPHNAVQAKLLDPDVVGVKITMTIQDEEYPGTLTELQAIKLVDTLARAGIEYTITAEVRTKEIVTLDWHDLETLRERTLSEKYDRQDKGPRYAR